MRKIKDKIGALVLICVLLAAAMIGFSSIQSVQKIVAQYSQALMGEQCNSRAEAINALLSRIEQSVTTLSDYALISLDNMGEFQTNDAYVRQYSGKLSEIAVNAAQNTEGAMTVYIRFNPEFTEPTSGIFASRDSANSSFEKLVPTDFSMYDPSDTAHVGWYYEPVNRGEPIWMHPYLNENLNVNMVSYVIPLTKNGISVGVVGMDIDFSVLEEMVDEAILYKEGFTYLVDAAGETVYKSAAAAETGPGWVIKETSLQNGMKLVLAAPQKEISAAADNLIKRIILLSAAGVIFSLFVSAFVIRGIIGPIRHLNDAAGKIAQGQMDVAVTCSSKDEIGALAQSFQRIVERLQTYMDYIEEASAVLCQLAAGNLQVDLKKEYAGEFYPIKEALLNISSTLQHDIGQIQMASEQIAVGSEVVSDGAQTLSMGTIEQTEAIKELTIQLHALSENIKENEAGAISVYEMAGQAGASLQQNSVQMQAMVQAMASITKSTEEIIHMTSVIEDIAMQTNILALNASIEAARAGEAGKGFSIVAEEVKNLAVKSTEAATKITDLVRHAESAITDGSKIATETERSVIESAGGAKAVVEIAGRMSDNSTEQTQAVEMVLLSMDRIEEVVQQASATSEESAASAEELSSQAQMMKGLVEKFRLKNEQEE